MLTERQKELFCGATAQWNSGDFTDDIAWVCEPDEVVETRETVEDFKSGLAGGEPSEVVKTEIGDLLVWNNVQSKAGCRRGDLFVFDFGDARAAHFSGEW